MDVLGHTSRVYLSQSKNRSHPAFSVTFGGRDRIRPLFFCRRPCCLSWIGADTAHFNYVDVISPKYLYQGQHGVLALDKGNGNVWFIGNSSDPGNNFRDPVLVARLPLEHLDQSH